MNNKATIVVLSGELDVRRRDELDHILDRYGDAEDLVFNFASVESLDTAALRSLVRFQRARRDAGKAPAVLAGPTQRVRTFMDLVRLGDSFDIRDEVEG